MLCCGTLPHPHLASDQERPLGTADSHAAAIEETHQEPHMQELAEPSAEQGEAQTFDTRATGGAVFLGTARFS